MKDTDREPTSQEEGVQASKFERRFKRNMHRGKERRNAKRKVRRG